MQKPNSLRSVNRQLYLTSFLFLKELLSKRFFFVILILTSIFFIVTQQAHSQGKDPFVLVVDAGHGGKDSGTRGVISYEKDIALAIALKFGAYVEERMEEVEVIYTRKTDVFIELHERANIANKHKADLFVSIHVDGVENNKVYGTSTFVMGLHKNEENLEVAKRENAVIMKEENYNEQYSGFNPESPESYIRISLEQNAYLDLSLSLAAEVQDQFTTRVKRKNRGVKQAGFLVLWKTTMPSVLIETGFLTNEAEERFLNTEDGQDYIASAIFRAFKKYYQSVETKSLMVDSAYIEEVQIQEDSGIRFKVQVASSPNPVKPNTGVFTIIENVVETKEGNVYKYTVGNETDYDKIINLQEVVREQIKDAFIVAYKNGEKISVRKALKELK